MDIFNAIESEVRSYCRHWPTVFVSAHGSTLTDESGRQFIDFFSGASALNYGHNHPIIKNAVVQYLLQDGIVHGLDMATGAKRLFLSTLASVILTTRQLDYKVQFSGPAGVNAVEAALRLARKATRRNHVLGFGGGFHGMAAGALQVSDPRHHRYTGSFHSGSMPFDDGITVPSPTAFKYAMRKINLEPDQVAAIIVEIVQGEGGVRPARCEWLATLEVFCRQHGILIIVDDIQAGCGRTGPFMSFEDQPIYPDIVCLSKSISGYGFPLSIILLRPALDVWHPGEHNGTFRGNNLAFIAGAAALNLFWHNDKLQKMTLARENIIKDRFQALAHRHPSVIREFSGRGMFWGVKTVGENFASEIRQAAFEKGLILETCGSVGEVLKIMPALTIMDDELERGLSILDDCIKLRH